MAFKISGCILIVFFCCILGLTISNKTKYKVTDLEEYKRALTIYIGELKCSHKPLGDIFRIISERTNGVISITYKTASEYVYNKEFIMTDELWKNAVDKNISEYVFDKEEMELLYLFSNVLVSMYSEQQISISENIISMIDERCKELQKDIEKNSKLFCSAGLLTGLMLCVILF